MVSDLGRYRVRPAGYHPRIPGVTTVEGSPPGGGAYVSAGGVAEECDSVCDMTRRAYLMPAGARLGLGTRSVFAPDGNGAIA